MDMNNVRMDFIDGPHRFPPPPLRVWGPPSCNNLRPQPPDGVIGHAVQEYLVSVLPEQGGFSGRHCVLTARLLVAVMENQNTHNVDLIAYLFLVAAAE